MIPRLLLFRNSPLLLLTPRQPIRQHNRHGRNQNHEEGHYIRYRPIARAGELAENPDGQGGLLARCESGEG